MQDAINLSAGRNNSAAYECCDDMVKLIVSAYEIHNLTKKGMKLSDAVDKVMAGRDDYFTQNVLFDYASNIETKSVRRPGQMSVFVQPDETQCVELSFEDFMASRLEKASEAFGKAHKKHVWQ
jgi:hypothetical protein